MNNDTILRSLHIIISYCSHCIEENDGGLCKKGLCIFLQINGQCPIFTNPCLDSRLQGLFGLFESTYVKKSELRNALINIARYCKNHPCEQCILRLSKKSDYCSNPMCPLDLTEKLKNALVNMPYRQEEKTNMLLKIALTERKERNEDYRRSSGQSRTYLTRILSKH